MNELCLSESRSQISVITATYNAVNLLPQLVDSLRKQTDDGFVWIVADGGSSDGTIEYLRSIEDLEINLVIRNDFGIYDALNGAIKECSSEYYIVIGSDDRFEADAIENYKKQVVEKSWDFVAASWQDPTGIKKPLKGKGWLYGMRGVVSCHSVALLIKKDLHEKYGFYSNSYPVCADQYFVKKAIYGGATVLRSDFVSGFYSASGYSASSTLLYLTDFFRVQLCTEKYKLIQIVIFILRLIKNYKRI